MWIVLVFAVLAGIVAGESSWKSQQQYIYDIHSRTLTALPDLRNQYVGVITKGRLVLQVESENVIIGKLKDMAHAHFHDDMDEDWRLESMENYLNFEETELNDKSFLIYVENGMIQSVSVDSEMRNDQVNQLKAILNQLQTVRNEKYFIRRQNYHQIPETRDKPHGMYSVMEPNIMGNCEMMYDIEPVPAHLAESVLAHWTPNKQILNQIQSNPEEQFFQIVKTMNFSNCVLSRGYHYGLSGQSDFKVNTNQMGKFFSKSSVTKMLAKGNWRNYKILNSYTSNRVLVSPTLYQDQQAEVISQIQITLSPNQQTGEKLERPANMLNAGNLVYRYDLPSDKDNKVVESDEDIPSEYTQKYNDLIKQRVRRSLAEIMSYNNMENSQNRARTGKYLSASSSSSSSSSSAESDVSMRPTYYYQPTPNMQDAPEIPLYHYTVGNRGSSIRYDNSIKMEREARKLIIEIVDDLQNQNEIPRRDTLQKFDILSDLMRTMNVQQIRDSAESQRTSAGKDESISETLYRKVYMDAVAVAGTGPAVNVVLRSVSENKVSGVEAEDLLEDTLRNIRIPTEELMKEIFDFLRSDKIQQNRNLYSVTLIAFTNHVRRAHVEKQSAINYYPSQAFKPTQEATERFVTKEFIPYLKMRLQQVLQQKNKQQILLYIRAMGNLGHRDILSVYESYLENHEILTPFQRTALVVSLDKLTRIHPRLARDILFKIYTNVADTPEMRSLAILLLMRADPTVTMLQRMAEMTHSDPSEAVQSMVKSAIETAAELKDNKSANLASRARSVRHLLNPRTYNYEYSRTYLRDYVSREMNIVYKHQFSHIIGKDHVIPKGIFYEAYKNYGGFQTKTVEFQAMMSSVEELLRFLPSNKYDSHDHSAPNPNGQDMRSTHQISEQLDIEPEVLKHLEGQVLLKLFGRKRFFSFDENTMRELPRMLASRTGLLKEGESLRYNKMYTRKQITVAFPLATGYPFIYTYNMPTLIQAIGNIQMRTTPSIVQNPTWETIRSIHTLNVTAKVHLVFSSDQIAKVGFITPFDRQRYIAGHVRKAYTHLPLNMKVDVDVKHGTMSGKFAPIDSHKNFNAIEASSWPFTLRKDVFDLRPAAEAKDLKLIKSYVPHVQNRIFGEKSTGMAFNIHMEDHFPAVDRTEMYRSLWSQGINAMSSLPKSYKNFIGRMLNNHEQSSFWSLFPFTHQRPTYNGYNVLFTMASLPYLSELSLDEFVKTQGVLSLISLPFSDIETLEHTTERSTILTAGGLPWPLRTLDQFHYNVEYDADHSANQVFKLSFNVKKHYSRSNSKSYSPSNRMQGPYSMEEKKLAVPSNTTPDSEERRQQFLENVIYGIKQASAVVLDTSLVFDGNKRTEYVITVSKAKSPVDEKKRVLIFMSAKPIKSSAARQISVTYTGKSPRRPMLDFEQALQYDEKSNARVHIYMGEDIQTNPTYLNVKLDMEQTQEYKNFLANKNPAGRRCRKEMSTGESYQGPYCLNATYWTNLQDRIVIKTEVENTDQKFDHVARKIFEVVRYLGYWNWEEQQHKDDKMKSNYFETDLRFEPTMNNFNLSFVSGDRKYVFRDFPVDSNLASIFTGENLHTEEKSNMRDDRHICTVDERRITTFDRNMIANEIGNCWYTMMQTKINPRNSVVSTPREVSILVRRNDKSEQYELMVVAAQRSGRDHTVRFHSESSKVTVDDQERKTSTSESIDVYDDNNDEEPAVRVYQRTKTEYVVQIGESLMQIVYDGRRIRIHANPRYRDHVYGLCGTFTGEKYDDLTTPKKCMLKNEKFFTASWALTDESCSNEVKQMKKQADQYPCSKLQYYSGNFINKKETGELKRQESDSSSSSSSEERYKQKNQMNRDNYHRTAPVSCNVKEQIQFIENDEKICFTMDALPACPSHCTAERKVEMKVNVHCRNMSDSVAQLYKQQIVKGANPDISSRPVSRVVTFNVPRSCVVVY